MALTAADKVEIHELVARYNRAIDSGHAEDWAATFTADGEFEGVVGHYKGTAELVAFAEDYNSNPKYAEFRAGQHWVNNLIIDGDENEATLFCHQLMIRPGAGAAEINLMGWYDDRLRKENGAWRFTKRKVNPVMTSDQWVAPK